MGRGISEQQKQILGVAYHANRISQGEPKLKTGAPLPNYRVPTVDYNGGKDMLWPLAAHVLRGLPFTEYGQRTVERFSIGRPVGGYFDLTGKEAKSVKAATIRAITSLEKRGLLIYAPVRTGLREGYVLTREGFDIAAENEIEFDPLVYVRAGLIWFPQCSCNPMFWRCYHYVEDHPQPLSEIIRNATEIEEHTRRHGYERNGYQVRTSANPITLNPLLEATQ